jgi:hypothetical protein
MAKGVDSKHNQKNEMRHNQGKTQTMLAKEKYNDDEPMASD